MKKILGLALAFASITACTSGEKTEHAPRGVANDPGFPASVAYEAPSIKYFTYTQGVATGVDQITPQRWANFRDGGRTSFLSKFYFATATTRSNRGLGHAVCFTGSAQNVIEQFLNPANPGNRVGQIADGRIVPQTSASSDGMLLGIRFRLAADVDGKNDYFFRIPQCNSNKGVIGGDVPALQTVGEEIWKSSEKKARMPASAADGFVLEDQPQGNEASQVPVTFKLRADYENIHIRPLDRPWKGMDLTNSRTAYEFSLLVQRYVYEGMFQDGATNPDVNLIASRNVVRDWCHMPWQASGDRGREWVHGLTKEFDLKPSPSMSIYGKPAPGSDWGIAFYNSYACSSLATIFGPSTARREQPDFSQAFNFPDGALTVKFLFTTANVPGTDGAFKWHAHVSGPGSTQRALGELRHVQMDVAIKDSSLKGVSADSNHWLMITYYFDPNYDANKEVAARLGVKAPFNAIAALPPAFLKMRPQGIVTSFDAPTPATGADTQFADYTGPSIIFKGAETNDIEHRLNGPVDNPKSSCLGCHATAGTTIAAVPGPRTFAAYQAMKNEPGLNFNQQLAKAKENYETQIPANAHP